MPQQIGSAVLINIKAGGWVDVLLEDEEEVMVEYSNGSLHRPEGQMTSWASATLAPTSHPDEPSQRIPAVAQLAGHARSHDAGQQARAVPL